METEKYLENVSKYYCKKCDYHTSRKSNWEKHILTQKHKMETDFRHLGKKVANNYYCEKCDYVTSKLSHWNDHIKTKKHTKEAGSSKQQNICEVCNREFKTRNGLWKHKKNCTGDNVINNDNSETTTNQISSDVIMKLLTQNQELLMANQEFKGLLLEQQQENQKQQQENQKLQSRILETESKLLEAVKEGKTINNTNCNNNNKFNLNFFLNEQCKNAMNISEFINTMVLTVDDLKNTGKLGYIDGISKIFADKLKQLDTFNRPMHCTDLKRETLYIKQNNEWDKDTDKEKIKTAIELVANKNLNNLSNWKEENPNHVIMDSKEDKEFVEIMTNSLGGMGSDREKNKDKIIKNVLKEVIVEK